MRKFIRMPAVWTVVALALAGPVTRADEEKVPLDKLPKPVLNAVKARFPRAELKGAGKETEDGKTVFEVALVNQGQKIDVTLTADGKIAEMEKEIDATKLPKAVSGALDGKYPKAMYKRVEEVIKVEGGTEKLAHYEVLLVTADKKTVEVEVGADGKILKTTSKEKKEK